MSPIIAGVISGALMGLFFDFLTIQALLSLRKDPPRWLQNALNQVSFFRLVAPMALFTHSGWTFAGPLESFTRCWRAMTRHRVLAAPLSASPSACSCSQPSTWQPRRMQGAESVGG